MANFYEDSVKALGQLFGGTPASQRLAAKEERKVRSDALLRSAITPQPTPVTNAVSTKSENVGRGTTQNRNSSARTGSVDPTPTAPQQSEFSKTFTPEYFAALTAAENPTTSETTTTDAYSPLEEGGSAAKEKPDTRKSFSIDNFRTELNNYGVLPTHSYLVRFAPFKSSGLTNALNNYTTINKDKLIMRCDSAILPAVSLIKEEAIRRYGYGPTETVPYNVNFGDFTLQWIVDNNSEVVDFFNKWINLIVNHDSKGGADMRNTGEFNNYQPYEVGFKDDYSNSKVSVFVYDRQLNTTIEYNIFDAFPISIQSINLAWGDENQMMKYNVTFAFTDMVMKTPKAGDNALFLAAQQAATEAAAARSPNEEKGFPGEIFVTGLKGNRQSASGPFFGSSSAVGNYTIEVPPEVQQQINTAAAKPTSTINVMTIPLTQA